MVAEFAGYKQIKLVYDGLKVRQFEAISESKNEPVVLYLTKLDHPSPKEISDLESHWKILSLDIGPEIARAVDSFPAENGRVLVFKNHTGQKLADLMQRSPQLTIEKKLDVLVGICKGLAALHERKLIHGNLSPGNVYFDLDQSQIQLWGLELIRSSDETMDGSEYLSAHANSLAYLSPEQTGRIARAYDYRSDFYSLGIIAYELFAGQLPFHATDEIQWIHAHLAQTETPAHLIQPSVPLPLSLVIGKLMKKDPEDRYQSALGLLHDLQRCRILLSDNSEDSAKFVAGSCDVPADFVLSKRLYGREENIQICRSVLESGSARLIFVEGEAGVGKSVLVRAVTDAVEKAHGYFVTGKFDQFNRDKPLSALVTAFNQLINHLLAFSNDEIEGCRKRLAEVLSEEDLLVLLDLLPRLELVCKRPPRPVGPISRARNLQLILKNFIAGLSFLKGPLVVFLDDIQWSDVATRSFLAWLLGSDSKQEIFFIIALRSDECDKHHPVYSMIQDLKSGGTNIVCLHLENLNKENITDLIADSFQTTREHSEDLADLVFEKTKGNPFFVKQFLRNLFDQDLLHFYALEGWRWNLDGIRAQKMTDNVLSLLISTISALDPAVQNILRVAACTGTEFSVSDLRSYHDLDDEELAHIIQSAAHVNLVSQNQDGLYEFVHDRVREALYSETPLEERQNIHREIAKRILEAASDLESVPDIFALANHWNLSANLAVRPDERILGARINGLAARKAKNATAFDKALEHATTALQFLEKTEQTDKSMIKELRITEAESQYALGEFEISKRLFLALIEKANDPLEGARLYESMAHLAYIGGQYEDAIKWGRSGLALLKFPLPLKPGKASLLVKALLVHRKFKKANAIGLEVALHTEPKVSPRIAQTIALLTTVGESSYFVDKNLFAFIGLAGFDLSLRYRIRDLNGLGFFASLLWSKLARFEEAKSGLIAIFNTLSSRRLSNADARSLFVGAGFVAYAVLGFKESRLKTTTAFESLVENGDWVFAGFAALYLGCIIALTSPTLEKSASEIESLMTIFMKNRDQRIQDSLLAILLCLKTLQGQDPANSTYNQDWNESEFIARLRNYPTPNPLAWYSSFKLLTLFILHRDEEALAILDDSHLIHDASPFAPIALQQRLIVAILLSRRSDKLSHSDLKKWLRRAKSSTRFLKKQAEFNPQLYSAPYLLALASDLRRRGELNRAAVTIDKALEAAKTSEVVFHQPLAYELASEIYRELGREKLATTFLQEALSLYKSWGASAKFEGAHLDEVRLSESNSQLDLHTVLKAANVLMATNDVAKVTITFLKILIENAGAERGVFLFVENDHLKVDSEARVDGFESGAIGKILDSFSEIARSAVSYVQNTQETLVLESAKESELCASDPYVQSQSIQSLVCAPVISEGRLKGIVYLENNTSSGVFSESRVELIKVLSGQAAISVENAKLRHDEFEKIRMENELRTAQAVQEMLFPRNPKARWPRAKLSGVYQPASECGGDWWSYSEAKDQIFVWTGDATGHGAPAALLTSAVSSAVAMLETSPDLSPHFAVKTLSEIVYKTTRSQIVMTFFVGALNQDTGEFRYCRASHTVPIVLRRKILADVATFSEFREQIELLHGPNYEPLGVEENSNAIEYKSASIELNAGDRIVLYSDGLPELVGQGSKMWNERGFLQAIFDAYKQNLTAEESIEFIMSRAAQFRGACELKDDITLCILEYLPS